MNDSPPLVFTFKNSEEGYRWIAKHDNIIFYLYTSEPITLIKYCQDFDKKTVIECTDVYDAIVKIRACTKRLPLFKSDVDVPANYCS